MKKFLAIIALAALPYTSHADTYSVSKNFYLGFGAGVLSPNDVDLKASAGATANGITFSATAEGEFEFDNGYQISGLVGYRFNDFLSFETELGYTNFDYDKLNATTTFNITGGGQTFSATTSESYDIDGSISAFSMIFGPTLDFDVYDNLELLLGGGIGFSSYNDEVKSIAGNTAAAFDEDFTRFAAKFKTGANYSFTDQTYVQATYGFKYVDSSVEDFTTDFTAHSFDAKLVFNF